MNLLKVDNEEIQCVAASVLCNISEQTEVRLALTKCNAGPILIRLLMSPVDDIQSRSAIILSDLACVEGNQESIAEENGIAPLVNLLDSELEDVLVNAVNAIRVLCDNNYRNKTSVAECHGLEALVEFLTVDSRKFHLSRVMRKPTFWFPTRSDTNQGVQLQKMDRGLKFWI